MSNSKNVGSPEVSETHKPSTPLTRTNKNAKKRSLATSLVDHEGEDAAIEMDLTAAFANDGSPMRVASDSPIQVPSGLQTHASFLSGSPAAPRPSPLNPHTNVAPPPGARVPAPETGFRQVLNNLPTLLRLTPAVPPGRMEVVQTGIKLELAIMNLPRGATRGFEEYVNERAAGFYERPQFSVERIKLYTQPGEVVLFGKVGTAYDVRALHYLFCDIAKDSQLSYCSNTFPDLATAVENARPWFNQGALHTARASTCIVTDVCDCCRLQLSMCWTHPTTRCTCTTS